MEEMEAMNDVRSIIDGDAGQAQTICGKYQDANRCLKKGRIDESK